MPSRPHSRPPATLAAYAIERDYMEAALLHGGLRVEFPSREQQRRFIHRCNQYRQLMRARGIVVYDPLLIRAAEGYRVVIEQNAYTPVAITTPDGGPVDMERIAALNRADDIARASDPSDNPFDIDIETS